jgi:hypothetical protein
MEFTARIAKSFQAKTQQRSMMPDEPSARADARHHGERHGARAMRPPFNLHQVQENLDCQPRPARPRVASEV